MRAEERLEMIAELLSCAPTRSGIFGREAAAAYALADEEDVAIVAQLLMEAERVGSEPAARCLVNLERGLPSRCTRADHQVEVRTDV
jgi:hypothetical protein